MTFSIIFGIAERMLIGLNFNTNNASPFLKTGGGKKIVGVGSTGKSA